MNLFFFLLPTLDLTSQWGILNQVIRNSDSNNNIPFSSFLSVGQITGYDPQTKGASDTNLLFTTFDQKCNVNVNKHYGLPRTTDAAGNVILNTEWGNSITVQGQRALMTGFVKNCSVSPYSCPLEEDILYLAVKIEDGSLFVSFRYDIQQKLDVGMAIRWRQDTESALIAGETETREILGSGSSKDIFLLEIEVKGQVKKLELFGTAKTSEFHVDLTLSQDKNAVMLSNTPINHICDDHGPWLIERYNNITQQCRDAPYETAREKYKVSSFPTRDDFKFIGYEKVELVSKRVMLEQWIWCPKLKV